MGAIVCILELKVN